MRHAGNALVLLGDADGGVDDDEGHVGALDGTLGTHVGVELQVLVDDGALAHTGGVDEAVLDALVLDERVDGVTGGAGHVAHDGALLAAEAVEQGGLTGVGAADDGDADEVLGDLLLGGLGQRSHDVVEDVAHAVAVLGADGVRVAQAQAVELVGVGVLQDGVALVDGQEDRLVGALQDAGDGLVLLGDAGLAVDEEDDGVGLVDGEHRLVANLALERILGIADLDTAGIAQRELGAVPVRIMERPVTGDALGLVHDGLGTLGNSVDERGLAHIGPAHHCNDRLCHG